MVRILNQIDLCIKHNKHVYVHCWGGKGRTGTVVGCYLIRHGLAEGNDVINKIKQLRRNTKDFSEPSPETKDQINMVINWKKDL
jgi:protein-tyrosine phosphatase